MVKYKKGVKCPQRSHEPWNKYLPREQQPFYGRHHTEESKAYGNKGNTGKFFSEEHKKRISLGNTGKIRSEECKVKISLANTGRKFSDEINKKKGSPMEKNYFWNGGTKKHEFGYILIKTLKYPQLPRNKQGYVKRANVVWFENTGDIIKKPYLLHHIDKNPENDNFKNLQKLTFKEHAELENVLRKKDIKGRYI